MVHPIHKGRATLPAGLVISDLEATFTAPDDLEIAYTPDANVVDEQVQIWPERSSDKGAWTLIGDVTTIPIIEGLVHNCRVRGINSAGKVGGASNIVRFMPFLSSCTLRSAAQTTFLGNDAANAGIGLAAVGLTHVAGDLVVAIVNLHGVAGGAQPLPTQASLPAGWAQFTGQWAAQVDDQWGYRTVYWISDGTDQTIKPIEIAGATTNMRINYSVYSFPFTGTLEEGANPPAIYLSQTNPPVITVPIEETTDTVLLLASHATNSTLATFGMVVPTSISHYPTHNQSQNLSTTVTNRTRTILKVFQSAEPKVPFWFDSNDGGFNLVAAFYLVFRAPS